MLQVAAAVDPLVDAGIVNIDILAAAQIVLIFLMVLIRLGRADCCPAQFFPMEITAVLVNGRKSLLYKRW